MASILLRRVLTKDEVSVWANLQAQTQEGIKGELLKSLQEESAKSIVRKVRDVVCELAAGIFDDGKWPELMPFLFNCVVNAQNPPLGESALIVFAQLAEYIGESLVPHLATLHQILGQCLQAAERPVQLAALRACCCCERQTSASVRMAAPASPVFDSCEDLKPGERWASDPVLGKGYHASALLKLAFLRLHWNQRGGVWDKPARASARRNDVPVAAG